MSEIRRQLFKTNKSNVCFSGFSVKEKVGSQFVRLVIHEAIKLISERRMIRSRLPPSVMADVNLYDINVLLTDLSILNIFIIFLISAKTFISTNILCYF